MRWKAASGWNPSWEMKRRSNALLGKPTYARLQIVRFEQVPRPVFLGQLPDRNMYRLMILDSCSSFFGGALTNAVSAHHRHS